MGRPGYVEVLQWKAGNLSIQRLLVVKEHQISQVKEFSASLYMGQCKSLGSLKSSFDMHLSYLGPVSCIFTFWVSSGLTIGSGHSLLAAWWQVRYSLLSSLRAHQLTTSGGCNHWWLWQPSFTGMAGNRASLVAQMVKNLPAVWETQVWSLGWEDPLEKGIVTHSSILAWIIPWSLVGYNPWGYKELDMTEWLSFLLSHCRILKRFHPWEY